MVVRHISKIYMTIFDPESNILYTRQKLLFFANIGYSFVFLKIVFCLFLDFYV